MKLKLTKAAIANLPYAEKGAPAYIVRDTTLRNFFLLVGTNTKTFYVQRDVRHADGGRARTVRRSLGRWSEVPGAGVPSEAARQAAIAALAEIQATGAPSPDGMTFAEALALFDRETRAEKTKHRYAQFVRSGYLASWMDRPLRSLSRKEVRERHEALTREVAEGRYAGAKKGRAVPQRQDGRTTADDVFRWFRAVWNRAMKEDETLPVSPTINVIWHKVEADRTAIPRKSLAAWHAGVLAIPNPVRRDYLLFALFTGLRRESAAAVRWVDVDWTNKTLHIPKPKGGEERAFNLPLSDYLLALLKGRQRENPKLAEMMMVPDDADQWVFPAFGATGHIAEPRVDIPGVPYTIHDLRRTFISRAAAAKVQPHIIGMLVNHRQPRDTQTEKYMNIELEEMRAPMQAITDELRRCVATNK